MRGGQRAAASFVATDLKENKKVSIAIIGNKGLRLGEGIKFLDLAGFSCT
jgi:hypothetical protein